MQAVNFLRPNIAVRSKSILKFLQYRAFGLIQFEILYKQDFNSLRATFIKILLNEVHIIEIYSKNRFYLIKNQLQENILSFLLNFNMG